MADVSFTSIEEAFSSETGKFFWAAVSGGKSECGDPVSFLGKMIPDEHATFDVSNNKVLAHMDLQGTVKSFTTYRQCYPSDDRLPGVWWCKDFSQDGPFAFSLNVGTERYDLTNVNWPVKTELLDNFVPVNTMTGQGFEIKLILFAPSSQDGSERPSAVLYGMWLRNTSPAMLKGAVELPIGTANTNVSLADGLPFSNPFPFELETDGSVWIPVVIASYPGEPVFREIEERSSLCWLSESISFFRGMTGALRMPGDPFLADFFKRLVNLCFSAIGMTRAGEIAGANWGSYPAIKQIYMKDMGYTYLPFCLMDPDLCKKGILWFLDKSVRFKGDKVYEGYKLDGGISYSLSNAMTPVIMAGLYYRATGDAEFFERHPEVAAKMKDLLNQVLASRTGEPFLFPSVWLSDGPSRGDYHTGSNVIVWFAFNLAAEFFESALGDNRAADEYRDAAQRIKADLDKICIVNGPFGRQYAEGVNADGTALLSHDGEESDTTLMPFYGYATYDDPAYQNHKRVAMTETNIYYKANAKGIEDSTWMTQEDNPGIHATFPGYVTGFAGVETAEEMSGQEGRLTIIRRLTDVDGSIWWWPYNKDKLVRAFEIGGTIVGKSGWSASVFILHFISQILGLRYNAPEKKLSFRPFSPTSDFEWLRFRMGYAYFSVGFERSDGRRMCYIENHNDYNIWLDLELILEPGVEVKEILVDGTKYDDTRAAGAPSAGTFFKSKTVKLALDVQPQKRVKVEVTFT